MNSDNMSRRERERLRHKNEILDAAERMFSQKGYHAVSMSDIAEEAEFATGTLYNFFKSKEKMYRALFARKVDVIWTQVASGAASVSDPREKIEKIIEANLHFAQEYREFFLLHMTEVLGVLKPMPLASSQVQSRYQDFIELLADIVEEGQRKRIFRQMEPGYAAVSLIGVMHNCAALWISDKNSISVEGVADMAKSIFFNGVVRKK